MEGGGQASIGRIVVVVVFAVVVSVVFVVSVAVLSLNILVAIKFGIHEAIEVSVGCEIISPVRILKLVKDGSGDVVIAAIDWELNTLLIGSVVEEKLPLKNKNFSSIKAHNTKARPKLQLKNPDFDEAFFPDVST